MVQIIFICSLNFHSFHEMFSQKCSENINVSIHLPKKTLKKSDKKILKIPNNSIQFQWHIEIKSKYFPKSNKISKNQSRYT